MTIKKVYSFHFETKRYIGACEAQWLDLENRYSEPANTTSIPPIAHDVSTEYLAFDIAGQQWVINELDAVKKRAIFDDTTGEFIELVESTIEDIEDLTGKIQYPVDSQISQLTIEYTTLQDIIDQVDIVLDNGIVTITESSTKQSAIFLEQTKQTKLLQLNNDYKQTKLITIQNGITFSIDADTQTREHFIKNIELSIALNEDKLSTILSYHQTEQENYVVYMLAYLWRYVLSEYWYVRIDNKRIYDFAINNIQNASDQESLDAIEYEFVNPSGIIIDVNEKVAQLEVEGVSEHPQYVLDAIAAAKDIDGLVHLVRIEN